MLSTRSLARTLLGTWLVGLATLASAPSANASSKYPPEVQKALSKKFGRDYCVPQCTLCHSSNVGGIGKFSAFGANLKADTGLFPQSPAMVGPALEKYFADKPNADSDLDSISDLMELEMGSSPSVAGTRGEGLICPDISYGCGARVAAAPPPPVDRLGLFSTGLALLGLAALRRRQRRE